MNGGAVPVRGGAPTVGNTLRLQIFGLSGNDSLRLNEANGTLPRASIFGGSGNDTLVGGSAADFLFGQSGNDSLFGQNGADSLFGGGDNDLLTGGAGDDLVLGQAGDDRLIWNPGDASDFNEGGAGSDTIEVNGGNAAEEFTATANGARVRLDRLSPGPFFIDIGTAERLVVKASGGDDRFSATGNLAPLIRIEVDGGSGNDTLLGGNGDDVLRGGDGDDFIDGNGGADFALLGNGRDTFRWDPGDGSDTVDGEVGSDTMLFSGSDLAERFDVSANGNRVRFSRDIGNITMDLDGVEQIDLNTLGGVDSVTVNDLAGTDASFVNIEQADALGGTTGDAEQDSVVVNGTDQSDAIEIRGNGTTFSVLGLHAIISVTNSEGANDNLTVNARGGDDNVNASTMSAGIVKLTEDGGAGNDTLVGSRGDDQLFGGDGGDFFIGFRGDDVVIMGSGNDVFEWLPGDGSDTVEGQAGQDTMIFDGANVDENFDISANGNRVRFLRDFANITMDLAGVEQIDVNAFGGADNVTIHDLTATSVTTVNVNLAAALGDATGDRASDSVIVNGTNGDDAFQIASFDDGTRVVIASTLFTFVQISGAEAANDRLVVNTLDGHDAVDAGSLAADAIGLTLNGGAGNDELLAGGGDDLVNGGAGNDLVFLEAGNDTFVWNPGDGSDRVEGMAGIDTLVFNGSDLSESISLSASGQRLRLVRDLGNVAMDVGNMERVNLAALGGADTIAVNDLTRTGLTTLNLDLNAIGGGDGQADNVVVNGTNGSERIIVADSVSGGVKIGGLAFVVNISAPDSGLDQLTINARGGNDTVDASGLGAGIDNLTINGGDGDDVLIGSDGSATLTGGAGDDDLTGGVGDDVLIGGPGQDILDGGPGNNLVIQD